MQKQGIPHPISRLPNKQKRVNTCQLAAEIPLTVVRRRFRQILIDLLLEKSLQFERGFFELWEQISYRPKNKLGRKSWIHN